MALIDRIESLLGRSVEFLFRPGAEFQPVDLDREIKRRLKGSIKRIGEKHYAPNIWKIGLPNAVYEDLRPLLREIEEDLLRSLEIYLVENRWLTCGPLGIQLEPCEASEIRVGGTFGGQRR